MGGLVEMKIHYRKPTVLEQIADAIRDSKKTIDYIELTSKELDANYSNFDRSSQSGGGTQYSYKGVPIRVKE
jgi:hypothetical protein